ncbi:DUF1343 domain-containing protein [Geminisphaera colitermitum]|uniref:DUF1343 domain-containing protein n=1 Tax=Geminisphaera colitermitum TaxID=1148786 RepID=UPI0005B93544|nr:DUF1343 domain-containing protein [Geminisphaera colitermitum]
MACSARKKPVAPATPAPTAAPVAAAPVAPAPTVSFPSAPPVVYPVMLGIDVLEETGFRAVAGKKIGLLTHQAGVNRRGESTINVLRRAPQTKLVALFAPEHSLSGQVKASVNFGDEIHTPTGLPVYSLHGKNRKPTPAQLKGLDAVVIDLQDIGVRSYTFTVAMRYTMDACFAAGVEVIVLDRPNPLGGLKVDGPSLDKELMSGVGAFRVPYVHGLTIGELARIAAMMPGVLDVPESVRVKGRLTIVPMRGWRRSMRWPETGLTFVPTSPMVRDFSAVIGYAMTGLGCEYSGFKHGVGKEHPFRGLSFKGKKPEQLAADLTALKINGVGFRKINGTALDGKPASALYVEITNWDAWEPTQLSFELMRLACRYNPPNPFAALNAQETRSFNIHVGSMAWWNALKRDGAKVNLEGFRSEWARLNAVYQQNTRRYWLYQP